MFLSRQFQNNFDNAINCYSNSSIIFAQQNRTSSHNKKLQSFKSDISPSFEPVSIVDRKTTNMYFRTGKISKLTESEASKKKIPLVFPDPEPTPFKPLHTLDIFAGAGGLSKGYLSSNN